ncbi:hypothetical protein EII17_02635 [Clostridiales bacterium COT073_COT-073]|nr:hypothetical protein EII17_02635 [Clostridiales bacterium COT073_COT-073]
MNCHLLERADVMKEIIETFHNDKQYYFRFDSYIREFMPAISSKYEKLLNPVPFNTIDKIATLEMVAQRGGLPLEELLVKMTAKMDEVEKTKN